MTKTLDTLVDDVYALFDPKVHHEVNDDYIEEFGENIKQLLRERLKGQETRGEALRFSALGRPDRQIWYASRGTDPEELQPKTRFKFLYGDVIEQLVLFLIKEAGHDVHSEQMEIEVDGVKGHIDAIVDGVLVDVKSASPFGYKKFENGTVHEDDTFGYIAQISGYSNVLTPGKGPAFIAFDKVSGDLCVSPVSVSIANDHPPAPRIEHLKRVIASDTPPPRCYEPVPDGKSGNMKLDVGCSYCAYKKDCWPGLRTFLYSNGPRYLTTVTKTPEVYEVQD